MGKGRAVPPPVDLRDVPDLVTIAVNPSAEQLAALMQPGRLLVVQYEHSAGCGAQRSQRLADCRCNPDVRVLTHQEGAR